MARPRDPVEEDGNKVAVSKYSAKTPTADSGQSLMRMLGVAMKSFRPGELLLTKLLILCIFGIPVM